MEAKVEAMVASFSQELAVLVKRTESMLSLLKIKGDDEKREAVEMWLKDATASVAVQMDELDAIANGLKEEHKRTVTVNPAAEPSEPPAAKVEPPKVEASAPSPAVAPKRATRKGRKLPSKGLLRKRAEDEDEDVSTTTLDATSLPENTEDLSEEKPEVTRRTSHTGVPLFNAAIMGDLSKALGARNTRLSKESASHKPDDAPGKASPKEKEAVPARPQLPFAMPKLKSTSPSPRPEPTSASAGAEEQIPPWKLELQKRKEAGAGRKSCIQLGQSAKEGPKKEENNELAAILQRRKQKSGG